MLRILVITEDSLYVLLPDKQTKVHHRSILSKIYKITVSVAEPRDQMVIHVAGEDDQHYHAKRSKLLQVVEVLTSIRAGIQVVEEQQASLLGVVGRDKTSAIVTAEMRAVESYLDANMSEHDFLKLGMMLKSPWI